MSLQKTNLSGQVIHAGILLLQVSLFRYNEKYIAICLWNNRFIELLSHILNFVLHLNTNVKHNCEDQKGKFNMRSKELKSQIWKNELKMVFDVMALKMWKQYIIFKKHIINVTWIIF